MTALLVVQAAGSDAPSRFEYHFDQDRIVIGRGRGADIRLPHAAVSLHHVTISRQADRYLLTDHGSTNGTRINGQPVVAMRPKPLCSGDVVAIGYFSIIFHDVAPGTALTTTERSAELARHIVRAALADVAKRECRPVLRVVAGPQAGRELLIPSPPARLIIGRAEHCDLTLSDVDCSREHVELICELDGCKARDLDSKNGSSINGKALEQRRLQDGDQLQLGNTELVFEDAAEAELRRLEAADDQLIVYEKETLATEPLRAAMEVTAKRADKPVQIPHLDWIIYALAAIVMGLSAAGLWMLFASR